MISEEKGKGIGVRPLGKLRGRRKSMQPKQGVLVHGEGWARSTTDALVRVLNLEGGGQIVGSKAIKEYRAVLRRRLKETKV